MKKQKVQFDYTNLQVAMLRKGYNQTKLAKVAGIAQENMSLKMNNYLHFRQIEMFKIMKELELENIEKYFMIEL